jgi:hypothetical protein
MNNSQTPNDDKATFLRLLRAAVADAGWGEDLDDLTDEDLSGLISLLLDPSYATPRDRVGTWVRDAL